MRLRVNLDGESDIIHEVKTYKGEQYNIIIDEGFEQVTCEDVHNLKTLIDDNYSPENGSTEEEMKSVDKILKYFEYNA